ncbi:SUZ domain-containing protein 1 isoform X1 [Osmia bicornis bicornis]|uniref:SUZ domain-containing protein 1 isoform X1 n=2 Tax=Osmia bicornis bicornis TaxID=1437191 RepID=UPI0010F58A96|nr:SUZ domain-containing protein 1 isoform X1 [Osmia bicornis bicornis]
MVTKITIFLLHIHKKQERMRDYLFTHVPLNRANLNVLVIICMYALEKKLDALQLNAVEALEEIESSSFKTSHNASTRMIMLGDDGIRSQYVPPRPTVKILKRPTRDSQGSGDGPLVNGDKPKQPIKSLKQREQEYAEARKRILGEEKSPEEKLLHEINRIQAKTITSSNSGLPSNVLRMPLGPDGTRGFNVRR